MRPDTKKVYESEQSALVKRLRAARMSVYLYEFLGSSGWGTYNVVYTYLLIRVGGYSTGTAATFATLEWVAYAALQFLSNPFWGALSDRIGRRPVLLFATSVLIATFLMLCWPNGYWWIGVGILQGSVDSTWSTCNAIVVDCVMSGAYPGDKTDNCVVRFIRSVVSGDFLQFDHVTMVHSCEAFLLCGRDTTADAKVSTAVPAGASYWSLTDDDHPGLKIRKELSIAFTTVWVIAGLGTMFGFVLGLVFLRSTSLVIAMATAGVTLLPSLLYSAIFLPETSPLDKHNADVTVRAEVAESFRVQAMAIKLIFATRRSTLLALAYFAIYFILTGIWDLGLFWGEALYSWAAETSTAFLVTITLAPSLGILSIQFFLVPNFGHARGIAVLGMASTLGCVALALHPWGYNEVVIFILVVLATVAWGAYPSLTALLTTNVEHGSQGHLQGSLFAFTTLGSLVALGTYLLVYQLLGPRSIWAISSLMTGATTLAVFKAGEGDADSETLAQDASDKAHEDAAKADVDLESFSKNSRSADVV
ncbi:hypothetical protein CTAYLR_002468 [Chrysophaeum taylorii]|uniref:Major facilitator superfamily (MFS) profile domain-containing protein n=1 Tax=Chrysophaeum taylorii TaxID=2483200 RepID=A0AAD7UMM8_9STRA|nr:hypothetical protein CTAYLR_002468 [Chrysophaeum taylorii]